MRYPLISQLWLQLHLTPGQQLWVQLQMIGFNQVQVQVQMMGFTQHRKTRYRESKLMLTIR